MVLHYSSLGWMNRFNESVMNAVANNMGKMNSSTRLKLGHERDSRREKLSLIVTDTFQFVFDALLISDISY